MTKAAQKKVEQLMNAQHFQQMSWRGDSHQHRAFYAEYLHTLPREQNKVKCSIMLPVPNTRGNQAAANAEHAHT